MTDLNKIIAGAKSIERILTEQFGGTGRGMREKLDSARYQIPQPLQQRIAYLARVRNRSVHEEDFVLEDSDDYLGKCQAVCAELQQVHAIAMRVEQERAQHKARARRRQHPLKTLLVLGLVLAIAWWVLRPLPSRAPELADPHGQLAGGAPGAATPPAVRQPAESRRESRVSAEAAPTQRASPAPVAPAPSSRHIGLGNDVLALEAVEFTYAKDRFDRLEPRITVTVRNTSERTIASAKLEARLYVNGESTPVVDTGNGRGLGARALYLGLGDSGLAPGASATSRIGLFGNDSFSVPDAINGSERVLVLRVAEVSDGRRQAFGADAPAWPAIGGEREAAALRPAQPTLDVAAYRERFAAGEHVVLGDSRIDVSKLALRLHKDSWGRDKVGIFLDLTNRSGVTLAHARFDAQLFVKGEQAPLAESGRRPLHAFFGNKGLADGASASTGNISGSFMGEWDAPDVLNAVREGRAQLVLRLASLTDGRNASHDSAAIGLNRR